MAQCFQFVVVIFLLNGLNKFLNVLMFAHAEDELCFSVIGDIGGLPRFPFQTIYQRKVARLLAKVMEKNICKFVVGLGDNFYFSGVTSVTDPRFYFTYERTYSAKSLNVPWYMIAGNHDHVSNVSAQIKYSEISKRWKFPDFYYSKIFQIPKSKKTLQLVMIDTTMLCWHNKQSTAPPQKTQLQWIENTLRNSSSSFLVVAGHHPVFSSGSHGNTECLIKLLKPLFEKYEVSVYFSGHDHNLQYVKEKDSDVHYVISGSGNFVDGNFRNREKLPKDSLNWQEGDNGFVTACASNDKLNINVYTMNNEEVINQIEIKPRNLERNLINMNQKKHGSISMLSQIDIPSVNGIDAFTTSNFHVNNLRSLNLKRLVHGNAKMNNSHRAILTKPDSLRKYSNDKLNKFFKYRAVLRKDTSPKSQKLKTMFFHGTINNNSTGHYENNESPKEHSDKTSFDISALSDISLSSYGTLPSDYKSESTAGTEMLDSFITKTSKKSTFSFNTASVDQETLMQTKLKDILESGHLQSSRRANLIQKRRPQELYTKESSTKFSGYQPSSTNNSVLSAKYAFARSPYVYRPFLFPQQPVNYRIETPTTAFVQPATSVYYNYY